MKKKIRVLCVDDDIEFNRIITCLLEKSGYSCQSTQTLADFMNALKALPPDICLIDLNIDKLESGYDIVKKIRSNFSLTLPLLIVSGQNDASALTHAMELGANDFVLKPVDPKVLVRKLAQYAESDLLETSEAKFFNVPADLRDAVCDVIFKIAEVDEFGLYIQGPHLISKGSAVKISGDFLRQIAPSRGHLMTTVVTSAVDPVENGYRTYLEFDAADDELGLAVRHWLFQNRVVKSQTEI